MLRRPWFSLFCVLEFGILLATLLIGVLARHDPLGRLAPDARAAAAGVAGAIPLLALFLLVLHGEWPALREIRALLDSVVRPLFARWSLAQLAIVSALAGLAEEAFFRGMIQDGLRGFIGPGPAICAAAFAFGIAHRLTRAYAILAGIAGLYLGAIHELTGNLLTPIVAHATYDFAALILFLRLTSPPRDLRPEPPAS